MPDVSPAFALQPRVGVIQGVFDALGGQDKIAEKLGVSPSVISRAQKFAREGGRLEDYPFRRETFDRILVEARRQRIGLCPNDLLVFADELDADDIDGKRAA